MINLNWPFLYGVSTFLIFLEYYNKKVFTSWWEKHLVIIQPLFAGFTFTQACLRLVYETIISTQIIKLLYKGITTRPAVSGIGKSELKECNRKTVGYNNNVTKRRILSFQYTNLFDNAVIGQTPCKQCTQKQSIP